MVLQRNDVALNDNFLHYMLKEVFAVNFFDLRHSVSNDNALEIFMYLFPYHLNTSDWIKDQAMPKKKRQPYTINSSLKINISG